MKNDTPFHVQKHIQSHTGDLKAQATALRDVLFTYKTDKEGDGHRISNEDIHTLNREYGTCKTSELSKTSRFLTEKATRLLRENVAEIQPQKGKMITLLTETVTILLTETE